MQIVSWRQSQEHFLQCHQNAFSFLGVPESVMLDNCKTAVLSHPVGQPAQYNPRYLDFANHYGFKVRACGVRKGNEKPEPNQTKQLTRLIAGNRFWCARIYSALHG